MVNAVLPPGMMTVVFASGSASEMVLPFWSRQVQLAEFASAAAVGAVVPPFHVAFMVRVISGGGMISSGPAFAFAESCTSLRTPFQMRTSSYSAQASLSEE